MELQEFKEKTKAAKMFFILRTNIDAEYASIIDGAFFSFDKAVEHLKELLRGPEGKLDSLNDKKSQYFYSESFDHELEEFRCSISGDSINLRFQIKNIFLYDEDINEIIDMNLDKKER